MLSVKGKEAMAWLEIVTLALREHDASWPKTMDENVELLGDEELAARASLRSRWEDRRKLYEHDVKMAAERCGLSVDAHGYPVLSVEEPPPVVEAGPRNGFLTLEDAARLRGMLDGSSAFSVPGSGNGELRFRQIVHLSTAEVQDGPTVHTLLALDMDGFVWSARFNLLAAETEWWREPAVPGR